MICIRDLIVDPSTFLSPMAGLTDSVFRRLIKRLGGCGLVMTEFTSAEGLTRNSLKSKRMLFYHEEERPVTAQLFGAEPSRLAEATRMVEDLGFDAIDLNLGCPAKKVVKACGGSALLRETKLLEEILKTIRAATQAFPSPSRFGPDGAKPKLFRSRWVKWRRILGSTRSPFTREPACKGSPGILIGT